VQSHAVTSTSIHYRRAIVSFLYNRVTLTFDLLTSFSEHG